MHKNARFRSTYIALVALAWESLERVDQRLDDQNRCTAMLELQSKLQLLRLELLQLGDKSQRLAESGLVSASQNTLMQRFAAKLLAWLALDAAATTDVLQMRIRHAQNWLFSEARQWSGIGSQDRDVNHASTDSSPARCATGP